MDARFRNKMHSDFFATPPRQIRHQGWETGRKKASAEYTPHLNFFSHEYKSECDTESSDLESIISLDSTQGDEGKEQIADVKLHSAWDVYFLRNDVIDWDDRLVYVTTFATVKEFWAIYQHMKLPSHLPQGCDYMIFRSGIGPCWENVDNINGGRWMCELERSFRNEQLDAKWLETLLALIGEQLGSSDRQINGAVVQSRKKVDRISIWLRECENDYETKNIGHKYYNLIGGEGGLKFQTHETNTNRQSSAIRFQHVIY